LTNPISSFGSREFHDWVRQNRADLSGGTDLRETHDWLRKNNAVAAAAETEPLPLAFLYDAVVVPGATNGWESATPTTVKYDWALMTQESEKQAIMGKREGVPDTFYFRTRGDSFGVLQVIGFSDDPRGVKIRYKLVQNNSGEN
jgi:hypothetical protein